MRSNAGPTDRIVRLLLGTVLAFVALTITGPWVWVAVVFSLGAITTEITGVCPLYALLRLNTNHPWMASGR